MPCRKGGWDNVITKCIQWNLVTSLVNSYLYLIVRRVYLVRNYQRLNHCRKTNFGLSQNEKGLQTTISDVVILEGSLMVQ